MTEFRMQIETPHPLLFLENKAPDVEDPPCPVQPFVTTAKGSLCFRVLAPVDGATCVTISDQACPHQSGLDVFSGTIDASSGVLSLISSERFTYINIPVPAGPLGIDIHAQDDQNPDWVWITLGAIRNG